MHTGLMYNQKHKWMRSNCNSNEDIDRSKPRTRVDKLTQQGGKMWL